MRIEFLFLLYLFSGVLYSKAENSKKKGLEINMTKNKVEGFRRTTHFADRDLTDKEKSKDIQLKI